MNIIPNNIQAKEFRYRIECRDQLQYKGDLYVGTGTTEEVELDDGTTKNMQKTEPLYRTTDGLAPASDDSNQPTDGMALLIDNSNSTGWKVGKVGPEGLDRRYYVYNEQINFAAGIRGTLNGVTWSQTINPNQPSSSLKLMPTRITSLNTNKTLVLPFENGTLATREQIENGDIVAKIASSLKGDNSSQNQLFTSKEGTQNWAEYQEQSVLSTNGVTSIQLGSNDLTTTTGIVSATFLTPWTSDLGYGLYVVQEPEQDFCGIACIYGANDTATEFLVALWGGMTKNSVLKANSKLKALKIGTAYGILGETNTFNALGLA